MILVKLCSMICTISYSTNSSVEKLLDSNDENLTKFILTKVFSILKLADLSSCCLVNHRWRQVANDPFLLKTAIYTEIAFNSSKWERWFNSRFVTGDEKELEFSSLPLNIAEILQSPCPIFPGKRVGETHILVRVSETVTEHFVILLKKAIEKHNIKYPMSLISDWSIADDFNVSLSVIKHHWELGGDSLIGQRGNNPKDKPHWVLITKDLLPGSRGVRFDRCKAIVNELAKRSGISYEIPKTIDALFGICAQYRDYHSRIEVHEQNPTSYTYTSNLGWMGQIALVGDFASGCLRSGETYENWLGVAAVRRISSE